MKKHFIVTLFALSLLWIFTGIAQAAMIDDILATRVEAESYTDMDVVDMYRSDSYRLLPDGRCEVHTQLVQLLRNYWACDNYGDPGIHYDSVRQDLSIAVSRTYMPGGKIVDTTPNGFNRVTPEEVGACPDYVNFQDMIVTMLGLEPGAITYFDYTLTDKEPLGNVFSQTILFGGRNPVLRQELTVEVPAGTSLKIKEVNGAPAAQKSSANGNDRYFWRMNKLSRMWHPDAEPFAFRFRPRVSFSNVADWNAVLQPLALSIAYGSELTPQMRSMVAEELSGELSAESRAQALQTYIHDRFNHIEYDCPLFYRTVRPAAKVFESGYGHSLDLSALYVALAREAGLDAEIALIFPNPVDVPSLQEFSKAWIVVGTDGGERYIDVTEPAGTCLRQGMSDGYFIQLKEGMSYKLEPLPWMAQPTLSELFVTWKLDKDNRACGEGVWRFSGALNYYGKMRSGDLPEFLTDLMKDFWPDVKVENVRVRMLSGFESELAFDLNLPSVRDSVTALRTLPLPNGDALSEAFLPAHFNLAERERSVPLFLKAQGEWQFTVRVEYPDEWKVVHAPSNAGVQNTYGSFTQTVTKDDKTVTTQRRVQLKTRTIPAEGWSDFRKILLPAFNANMGAIVFE
ncbi:DUF3857 domain-containing protein [bacterium]|nr:DUF3857 domain-containing protein [bacterium]